ncbi:MAG: carboxypeptidase-like regulatory domain-containing protein [Prolixibacteraceae bacterium]|nr:carboxypeptidase-like regulatory domain-containing protein [Prolixibacteraceae bacterium]
MLAQKTYTIEGVVTELETGNKLNYVDLVVGNSTTGTISDQNGNYLLHLAEGEYEITYSMEKYKQKTITVILNTNTEIDIELEKASDEHKNGKGDSGLLSFLFRGSKE